MYSLIVRDYSIADIEAFSALSIRRGSTIASLAKASSDNLRIVTARGSSFCRRRRTRRRFAHPQSAFLRGPAPG